MVGPKLSEPSEEPDYRGKAVWFRAEITRLRCVPQTPPPPITEGEEWAKSDTQMANVLADHFANVFKP